jgi:arginine:pyruvate transaminase
MAELSRRIRSLVPEAGDGWEIYYRARRLQASGRAVTMLCIGDHDVLTAPEILGAMKRSMDAGHLGYTPLPGTPALRRAIAARVSGRARVPAEARNVIVTAGGQGALFAAMMAALDPGQGCIVLDPYYASFCVTVRAVSADPVIVATRPADAFQPDAAAIEAALTPATRAILINTPNNPTGAVYARDRLEGLAELCIRRDLWLISDELYDSQVHDGEHLSPRDLPGMAERTLLVGSMSKGFAMTGARIGWIVAPQEAIARLSDLALATTYGLPGFIQDAAAHALTTCGAQEAEVARRYRRRRDVALAALGNGATVRVVPPQGGMYLMLDVRGTGLDGIGFAGRLLEDEGIAVMPGESFGAAAAGHVRVALTVPEDALGPAMTRIARLADRLAGSEPVPAGAPTGQA